MKITGKKPILIGSGVLLAAFFYAVFYAPLAGKLHQAALRCFALEKEAAAVRSAAASLKSSGAAASGGRMLLSENEISSAIEELSRAGKMHKVRFSSITPREASADTRSGYRALPVEIEAESGYQELGIFLGDLENLPKGLVTVESFDLAPDSRNPSLFKSRLGLNLYLSPPPEVESKEARTGQDLIVPRRTAKKSEHGTWTRNPFEIQSSNVSNAAGIVLNGIAYDKTRPAAIMNGNIVKVGDRVGSYKIMAIYPDKVVVSGETETLEIALNSETTGEV